MTQANERKNHRGEPKKSELLPKGDRATEIIEMLVAMYRAMESPEDVGNDDHRR